MAFVTENNLWKKFGVMDNSLIIRDLKTRTMWITVWIFNLIYSYKYVACAGFVFFQKPDNYKRLILLSLGESY
jgi:hypothetical protein